MTRRKERVDGVIVFVYNGREQNDDDVEDVEVTALVCKDENRVRLNIQYYSHNLEQDFAESVDLPIDVVISLAEDLKRVVEE